MLFLKTQPLLREVNDVLISYSGSRMRRLCSSYSAAGTAGHGYSRLLYWIRDSTNDQWKRSPNNPMFDVSKQYQICIMGLRLSDYISIFGLVFFFVMRDNRILKNFQFCRLSLGFMVEFWYNQRVSINTLKCMLDSRSVITWISRLEKNPVFASKTAYHRLDWYGV